MVNSSRYKSNLEHKYELCEICKLTFVPIDREKFKGRRVCSCCNDTLREVFKKGELKTLSYVPLDVQMRVRRSSQYFLKFMAVA